MALEVLGVFVAEEILRKLNSVAANGVRRVWEFEKELDELRRSWERIAGFLQHVDVNRPNAGPDVRTWLQDVKDLAYDAEDVLDDFRYETIRRDARSKLKNKVLKYFSKSNPLLFRQIMVSKVKHINEMLDKLISTGRSFGLIERARSPYVNLDIPQTTSFLDSLEVVIERDGDVSRILHMLLNSSNKNRHLSVIPIVGMGGLGKTTLAKQVYKEMDKRRLFDFMIWVHVSSTFDELTILGAMLEKIDGSAANFQQKDVLLGKLRKRLENKNFLLVLDDMWSENEEKWARLKEDLVLCNESNTNCVLVTTRNELVAKIVESTSIGSYYPRKLTRVECWTIIKNRTFGKQPVPSRFEEIGNSIAEKCRGLPLIAKVLSSTLGNEKTVEHWLSIQNSNVWELAKNSKDIIPILQLSFEYLPMPSLKQCFAYCAIFPKNFKIIKEHLVQQWISQGFFQPHREEKSVEDIAKEHFHFLKASSLFEDVAEYTDQGITTCKMHDIVHDLAQHVSRSGIWMYEDDFNGRSISDIRLLNMSDRREMLDKIGTAGVQRLRVLFSSMDVFENMTWHFESLRSLKVACRSIVNLPIMAQKSKHLRYLDISHTSIHQLPKSITKLYNLQTLICKGCYSLLGLPKEMGDLVNLSYLDVSRTAIEAFPNSVSKLTNLQTLRFEYCRNIKKFPEGVENLVQLKHIRFDDSIAETARVGRMASLQTLTLFEVGMEDGHRIEELRDLSQLKGELRIKNLHRVRSKQEARKANLRGKYGLRKLNFQWTYFRESIADDEDVLAELQPYPSLQSLEIRYFKGQKLPYWCSDPSAMPRLTELSLVNLECDELPMFSELPSLKILKISGVDVTRIGGGSYVYNSQVSNILFPSLKILEIVSMENLEKWEEPIDGVQEINLFPCLQKLVVQYCGRLKLLPDAKGCTSLLNLTIWKTGLSRLPTWLGDCNSLETLDISDCPKLISIPDYLGEMASLREISIVDCRRLTYFPWRSLCHLTCLEELNIAGLSTDLREFTFASPDSLFLRKLRLTKLIKLRSLLDQMQHLTSLKYLEISHCGLRCLPDSLQECKTLETLIIFHCPNLKYFPERSLGHLTCLKELTIGGFSEELEVFPLSASIGSSLKYLHLYGWKKLQSLPCQIQHLACLQTLSIEGFEGLEALPDWLGSLCSLSWLGISRCRNLKYLPPAESMKHLQSIRIWGCGLLQERCRRGGPEWPKISHIPNRRIL